MGRFVDSLIAYRILTLLVTPFENTEAFKLGIIDKKGKELKTMQQLNTVQQRDAYTLLHRLVYRLKRIIEKVPIENKKIVSLAAAYALIKESLDKNHEPIDLENRFINKLNENLENELLIVEYHFYAGNKKMYTFKQYSEEGEGAATAVPVNNIAQDTQAIEKPEGFPIFKKRKMLRRKYV